jgi:catechol 2,3-dioxygenase-like lactoylglutathione lyase family enzyme
MEEIGHWPPMSTTTFALPPISMIMLGVRDLALSQSFYEGRLGLKVSQKIPGFIFLATGAVTLILSESLAKAVSPVSGATEVVFSVDDIHVWHRNLLARGIPFIQEPHNVAGPMWAANFRDPDGHLLTLFGPERGAS